MSAPIDYMAIAIITVFTSSLCTAIGKEMGEAIISYFKKKLSEKHV